MSTTTATPQTGLSRALDIAALSIIVITFVLKFIGLETGALSLAMLLPAAGTVCVLIAVIDSVVRRGISLQDVILVVFVAAVFGLALAGQKSIAIFLGVPIAWGIGVCFIIFAIVMTIMKSSHPTGRDYSSFSGNDERPFDNHEQFMLANTKKATVLGFGIAGGMFLIAALVAGFMYSPCTKYCERVPGGCKSQSQIDDFNRSCEASCGNLERAKGTPYVETLQACAFSNTTAGACEEVTKTATTSGLWCEIK